MGVRFIGVGMVALVSGCFAPERQVDSGESEAGEIGEADTSDSASSSPGSASSAGEETDGESEASSDGVEGQDGPQLVRSEPADGATNASLSPYFQLHFDRIVSRDDAVGHIWVRQNGGPLQAIAPYHCAPDNDPMCLGGQLPEEFYDTEEFRLPSAATIEIVIDPEFADPDGNVNTVQQTTSYTTFAYDADFYDDSATIDEWCGGITYDAGTQSLFTVGQPVNNELPLVRKLPIPGGIAGTASTVARPTGAYWIDGLAAIDGRLYVPAAGSAAIHLYSDLAATDLMATEDIVTTTALPPPDDRFDGVWSIAQVAGVRYYSRECCYGATPTVGILRYDGANWSVFHSGAGLWPTDVSVAVAGATVDGIGYLFAAADGKLFRFDMTTGMVDAQIERDDLEFNTPDMKADSRGRLWIGKWDGIVVLDGTSPDLVELARRDNVGASRLTLREDGTTVHAYYHQHNSACHVGHLAIEAAELQP